MTDEHRTSGQLERALRDWAKAPPRTPAAEAARRVRALIREERPGALRRATGWRRLALGCALALALGAAALLWRGLDRSPAVPAVDAPPALPENVVVFWLDAETPVYFVVGTVADAPGGTP